MDFEHSVIYFDVYVSYSIEFLASSFLEQKQAEKQGQRFRLSAEGGQISTSEYGLPKFIKLAHGREKKGDLKIAT